MSDWSRIGFLSDLHIGSLYAPWPDEYEFPGTEGITIKASKGQAVLRGYLEDFLSREMADTEKIFFLGDLADGGNVKEHGRTLTTPELAAQVDVACDLLSSLKGRPIFSVSGSRYHQSLDTSLDRRITERLGGVDLGVLKHIRDKRTGTILQVAHGGSSGGVLYEGTAADRDANLLDMAEGKGKMSWRTDLIVRGHRHFFWYHRTANKAVLRLPAWKVWFPWSPLTEKYGKWQPDIGGVVVDLGPKGRIVVHERLYPLLHIHDSLIDL